jgi:hypothetical protein
MSISQLPLSEEGLKPCFKDIQICQLVKKCSKKHSVLEFGFFIINMLLKVTQKYGCSIFGALGGWVKVGGKVEWESFQ